MVETKFSGSDFYPTALTPPDMKVPVLNYATPAVEQEARKQSTSSSAGDWADLVTNIPCGDVMDTLGSTVQIAGDVGGAILEGVGAAVSSIGDIF